MALDAAAGLIDGSLLSHSPGNSGSYIPWTPGSKKRIPANPSKGRFNSYGHLGHNSYGQTTSAAQKKYNLAYREERRRAEIAFAKEQEERNKKDEGFWKSAWNATGGKAVSAAHDFMQENSTLLGGVGIALGVASMITPLGWLAGAALVGGFVLGAATTADACLSSQWGGCVMGVASLGMAGVGVAASRLATSALREAASSGILLRPLFKGGAYLGRALAGVGNVSSVGFATIGTVTGGNLEDKRREEW